MLVDHRTGDDAGVFRLDEAHALVQTVDFFTPVVDDPEAFGAIAAANALSDVYAMGGRPLTALSIAAFPEKDFPLEWAAAIVRGGHRKLLEAGCVLLGGHSVRDPEIKFGYAVTGLVDPERMLTNAAGRVRATSSCSPSPWARASSPPRSRRGSAPPTAVAAATRSMAHAQPHPRRGRACATACARPPTSRASASLGHAAGRGPGEPPHPGDPSRAPFPLLPEALAWPRTSSPAA